LTAEPAIVGATERRRQMHKLLTVTAVVLAALTTAATAPASDATVSLGNCVFGNGGHVTRPAGSTIVVRNAFATKNYGLSVDFLHAQSTEIAIDGGPAADVSSLYGEPVQRDDGSWTTALLYATGVTLTSPGDSMTFRVTVSLSHRFADVTAEPGQPLFGGPGLALDATCTVTAT
jgi:hypothetical protein